MRRWVAHIRRTISNSLNNDVLMLGRAGAYSALLCVIPLVLITATLVALSPEAEIVRAELRSLLYQMFPPDVPPLVLGYFQGQHHRSLHLIASSGLVFLLAANSVMTTLIEALRRAYRPPTAPRSFGRQVLIGFALTFISFFPLALASLLVVFGHEIELWMIFKFGFGFRAYVLILWRLARWSLALATSTIVIAMIYRMAAPRLQGWRQLLPGAAVATLLWFPSTLIFGWYVTRYAHYGQVYGSLAAGIALLIWLYIIMVSIIIGAEFNAELFGKNLNPAVHSAPPLAASSPSEEDAKLHTAARDSSRQLQ